MVAPSPDMTVQLVGGGLDWLGSIAAMVGSLAWPAFILTCVVLFRAEIRAILSQVTSIGIGNVTAQVDQSLRATEALSEATASEGAGGRLRSQDQPAAGPALAPQQPPEEVTVAAGDFEPNPEEAIVLPTAPGDHTRDRVGIRTGAASGKSYEEWAATAVAERSVPIGLRMTQAFKPVEDLIRALASRHGVPLELATEDAIMALTGMGVISKPYGSLLRAQAGLRNTVAKSGGIGISEFQAREYVEQLGESQSRLKELLDPATPS